jgi:hypothetical protein
MTRSKPETQALNRTGHRTGSKSYAFNNLYKEKQNK